MPIQAELIPAGLTQEEQAEVLQAMQMHVQSDDEVYLDVTHGFRHQPMLALGAAVLLGKLRNATIKDILYGALEAAREFQGVAPVVSLRWLLDLFTWADGIQQLRAGGRLRALTGHIRDGNLQKCLADTAFLLSINQVHQAGEAARICLAAVDAAQSDPLLHLTRGAIKEVLEEVAGCQRDTKGILRVGRAALREQDYVRASILLCTAVERHEDREGPLSDQGRVREIRDLRNSLAHAIRKPGDAVRTAMSARSDMEAILQRQFAWVESQV